MLYKNDLDSDNQNSINDRYSNMSFGNIIEKPTEDQIIEFQNLYETLYSINPQTDPQNFSSNLDNLILKIEKMKSFHMDFSSWRELHNYQFYRSIVSFLNADTIEQIEINIALKIINFINVLLDFKDPIGPVLLETDLLEQFIKIYQNYPGDLTPQILDALTKLSAVNRCKIDNEASPTEGVDRIFKAISINNIHDIALQSCQNSQNLDSKEMNYRFSRFLYKITDKFELLEQIQEFILNYISEKYSNGITDDYLFHVNILMHMSKHKETFPIRLFYELELHKFIVDMIFHENEEDKFIYPAMKCFIQIQEIILEPDFESPKINTNLNQRIFSIAFEENQHYLDPTRIASFKMMQIILNMNFQKNDDSLIVFLLHKIILDEDERFDDNKLNSLLNFYNDLSYQLKYEFIDFLNSFINFGSKILGNRFIEFLITFENQKNENILLIYLDAIDIKDERTEMLGIIGISMLIKECNNYCEGEFEKIALKYININVIEDIIDNSEDKELRSKAKILHSSLKHLPNRGFVQQS